MCSCSSRLDHHRLLSTLYQPHTEPGSVWPRLKLQFLQLTRSKGPRGLHVQFRCRRGSSAVCLPVRTLTERLQGPVRTGHVSLHSRKLPCDKAILLTAHQSLVPRNILELCCRAVSLASNLFYFFLMPETRGKSAVEIKQMFFSGTTNINIMISLL